MGGWQAITIESLFAYCGLAGIEDLIERHRLLTHVQAMDAIYLTFSREREKKSRSKKPTGR